MWRTTIKDDSSMVEERRNVLYGLDKHNNIRFSHENPSVISAMKNILKSLYHINHMKFYMLSMCKKITEYN